MQPRRITQRIQLGAAHGRWGFVMEFTDGTSEAFLFDLQTAEQLLTEGRTLLEALQQEAAAAEPPQPSSVGIQDAVKMRLVQSGE